MNGFEAISSSRLFSLPVFPLFPTRCIPKRAAVIRTPMPRTSRSRHPVDDLDARVGHPHCRSCCSAPASGTYWISNTACHRKLTDGYRMAIRGILAKLRCSPPRAALDSLPQRVALDASADGHRDCQVMSYLTNCQLPSLPIFAGKGRICWRYRGDINRRFCTILPPFLAQKRALGDILAIC